METPLEGWFIKALHLFHSKDKESLDELRQMLNNALAAEREGSSSVPLFDNTTSSKTSPIFEELSQTPDEEVLIMEPEEKRVKLDLASTSSVATIEDNDGVEEEVILVDEELDVSSSDDADLLCVICKLPVVTSDSNVIDCQECKKSYHTACHDPPISEANAIDPRFVFYCNSCTSVMKKPTSRPPVAHKIKKPVDKISDNGSGSKHPDVQPFKRIEKKQASAKPPTDDSPSPSRKPRGLGLAGLAVDWTAETDSTITRSSSAAELREMARTSRQAAIKAQASISSGAATSLDVRPVLRAASKQKAVSKTGGSLIDAEKRIQLMKKRAGAKTKGRTNLNFR